MSTLHVLSDFLALQVPPPRLPAQQVPNPGPAPLPGKLGAASDLAVGWMKTGLLTVAVASFLICAAMFMVGRRGRNNMAIEGVIGVTWVMGGLILMGSASAIVGAFL